MQTRSETHTTPDGATLEVGTVTHNGREFSALGHVLSADGSRVTGYLGKPFHGGSESVGARGFLTDWSGTPIGRYEITGRWRMPHSWVASHMVSARVVLQGGAVYTGRGMGVGMIWRGRRAKA
jgi:hypothetical protein